MDRLKKILSAEEWTALNLRALYAENGYEKYRMSKFEEYDLYARNKDFLVSDSVITFTDTDGKLLALKPDVTLSIIKNAKPQVGKAMKVYYHENVYRATKNSRTFRELMQVGLECLGPIDSYCLYEVLYLAARSLEQISRDSVLEISHLGVLSRLLDTVGIPENRKGSVLKCIGQKNLHELEALCRDVEPEKRTLLKELVGTGGKCAQVLPRIRALLEDPALEQLQEICAALEAEGLGDMLRFDFSLVDDPRYYNGIVFKGFIRGIPSSVLSGGQYDKLMGKMGRKSGAVGFAVYMDALERLEAPGESQDADVLLLYDPGTPLERIRETAAALSAQGRSVLVRQQPPEEIRCGSVLKISGSEVETVEIDA